jgi:hypothetical protein
MVYLQSSLAILWASSPHLASGFTNPKSRASFGIGSGYLSTPPTIICSSTKANVEVDRKLTISDGANETVDRAPCFDGVCDSQPVEGKESSLNDIDATSDLNGSAGEAILRLGTMTGPTVWSEFGRISQEYDVANLGQGMWSIHLVNH